MTHIVATKPYANTGLKPITMMNALITTEIASWWWESEVAPAGAKYTEVN